MQNDYMTDAMREIFTALYLLVQEQRARKKAKRESKQRQRRDMSGSKPAPTCRDSRDPSRRIGKAVSAD